MSQDLRVVVDNLSFLECPRWHEGRLWFSDFYTYGVYSVLPSGQDLRLEVKIPQQPSGLGWLPDGRLLIVSMRDRKIMRREVDGTLAVHADLSAHVSGHLNDMVVDAVGRAYVGEFGFDLMAGAPFKTANLLRVDPDGTVTVAAHDMFFPNGCVITDDGTLLVNETFGNRISAFDISVDGSLTAHRIWAQFAPTPTDRKLDKIMAQAVIGADGCCLDAEGALWVADGLGARALRVHQGGEVTAEIRPEHGVFACMLGGEDGKTLFLCEAPDFHEHARKDAREGRLLAVDVAVPRAGRP